MDRNLVNWFEVYVDDLERAKKFYESVFEVRLEKLPAPVPGIEMYAFPMGDMNAPGATGAIAKMEGVKAGGNSTLVYFTTADCALTAAKVTEAGGTVVKEKFSIGEFGFIAIALDTEGNTIGLHSQQ